MEVGAGARCGSLEKWVREAPAVRPVPRSLGRARSCARTCLADPFFERAAAYRLPFGELHSRTLMQYSRPTHPEASLPNPHAGTRGLPSQELYSRTSRRPKRLYSRTSPPQGAAARSKRTLSGTSPRRITRRRGSEGSVLRPVPARFLSSQAPPPPTVHALLLHPPHPPAAAGRRRAPTSFPPPQASS